MVADDAQPKWATLLFWTAAQELNALYGIGKAVSSSQSVEQVLERVVEAAIYLSGTDEGALQLIDEERGELYVHTARHIDRNVYTRQRIEGSRASQAILSRQTTILNQEELSAVGQDDSPLFAAAYVPLLIGGHPIGVLNVASRDGQHPLTKRETRTLSTLASFAASAIQNARLQQSILQEHNQSQVITKESKNLVTDDC